MTAELRFADVFATGFAAELLAELPGDFANIVEFDVGGGEGRDRIVRFRCGDESWVGAFAAHWARNGLGALCATADPGIACVIAPGAGYLVDVHARTARDLRTACPIDGVVVVPGAGLLVVHDVLYAYAFRGAELAWRSARLSLDGIRDFRLDGDHLVGIGWDGVDENGEIDATFAIDAATGAIIAGGIRWADG